jgi:hypothetical protein
VFKTYSEFAAIYWFSLKSKYYIFYINKSSEYNIKCSIDYYISIMYVMKIYMF